MASIYAALVGKGQGMKRDYPHFVSPGYKDVPAHGFFPTSPASTNPIVDGNPPVAVAHTKRFNGRIKSMFFPVLFLPGLRPLPATPISYFNSTQAVTKAF